MKTIFTATLVLFFFAGIAQDASTLRKKHFNITNGVAIKGYDPVAYFSSNKAIKGDPSHAVSYEGVTYYFSTAANAETFKKNPAKCEPQYGGWCAYAMGEDGSKVEVDPETFKIIDGKLFLFYNQFFNNTLKTWNKDETNLHQHADANWQKIYR